MLKTSRDDVVKVMKKTTDRVKKLISPSPITDFQIGFNDKSNVIAIGLTIKRDDPLSDDQILLLKRLIADELGVPVKLTVENRPFVQPLVFKQGETALSEEIKKELAAIKEVHAKDKSITVLIESYPESASPYKKRGILAEERAVSVSNILINEYGFPKTSITISIDKRKAVKEPFVKITLRPE